jgi:hypothetical protein
MLRIKKPARRKTAGFFDELGIERHPEGVGRPLSLENSRRFELLLDGNPEQRPSETEFVTVGVN